MGDHHLAGERVVERRERSQPVGARPHVDPSPVDVVEGRKYAGVLARARRQGAAVVELAAGRDAAVDGEVDTTVVRPGDAGAGDAAVVQEAVMALRRELAPR